MSVGLTEIIVIVAVVALVLGTGKSENVARTIGKGLKSLKSAAQTVKEEMRDVAEPVEEIKTEVSEIVTDVKGEKA